SPRLLGRPRGGTAGGRCADRVDRGRHAERRHGGRPGHHRPAQRTGGPCRHRLRDSHERVGRGSRLLVAGAPGAGCRGVTATRTTSGGHAMRTPLLVVAILAALVTPASAQNTFTPDAEGFIRNWLVLAPIRMLGESG